MSNNRINRGDAPPDFTLQDTSGEEITLSSFKGEKLVYLVFNRGFS
jgi:peroxiredoxin